MGPRDWVWSLEAGFKASRPGGGTEMKKEKKKKKKEEKIPHMSESIGHRPFRGRCLKMG